MPRRATMPRARRALVPKAQEFIPPKAQEIIPPKAHDGVVLKMPDVAALAREHTAAAVDTLVELLTAKDLKLRMAAAAALLDRGWGKPGQPVEAPRPFARLSDEQLTRGIDLLLQAMAAAKPAERSRKP